MSVTIFFASACGVLAPSSDTKRTEVICVEGELLLSLAFSVRDLGFTVKAQSLSSSISDLSRLCSDGWVDRVPNTDSTLFVTVPEYNILGD